MATHRRRALARGRRRVEDEGEEEGSVATELIDESQSEASIPSDIDEDADADYSDLSQTDDTEPTNEAVPPPPKAKGKKKPRRRQRNKGASATASQEVWDSTAFTATADTEAMMNGLKISEVSAQDEGIDFEAMGQEVESGAKEQAEASQEAVNRQENPAERRTREHEEYRKKRDADPAFIPNRGAFFMHDHRSNTPGQNGSRPAGRGRGRGRGDIGGPFSPANLMAQAAEATNGPWKHDLHETVVAPVEDPGPQRQSDPLPSTAHSTEAVRPFIPAAVPAKPTPSPRSFSKTTQLGNVTIRVSLPGMKAPITFSGVPFKQHTRLPNHRPPLRRDKPVRISLPDLPPRYIFPSTERSFIFIPRALRPNQQGFGRGRGRPLGSYGGFSSRRTSVYGGSVYSPSIALSRRSSLAREVTRDSVISPGGSVLSRPPALPVDIGRPIVRLPPGSQQNTASGTPVHSGTISGSGTPVVAPQAPQTYPLPQKPTFRENWAAALPMHQPKPQKAVSMAGIESPSLTFHAPQPQEQQPFHQQVPAHMNGHAASTDPSAFYPHNLQLPYPNQISGGTPLSNIPERAIHAQPFQPFQQQSYQPQGYPVQPTYYYPAPNGVQPQYAAGVPQGTVVTPMFVQNAPQGTFVVPTVPPAVPPAAPVPVAGNASAQPAMVAHESNGMVYYYDPSQLYAPVEGYAPASYAMPGMGGTMTPSPDGYYYPQMQPAVYYPPQ